VLVPTDADRLAARARPHGAAVLRQQWAQLLFLHWRCDPAAVQQTLPPGLTVDTTGGRAWLGVVPFFMRGVRPALCPPLPRLSYFLECNVRTYVFDAQGRPGVWFYSLDANSWLAVKVARGWYALPYFHAEMAATVASSNGAVDYSVRRRGAASESRFCYRALDEGREAPPGSLEFFLIERYRLYAQDKTGQLYTSRVAHAPYRISAADVPVWDDRLLRLAGFDAAGRPPDHICAASRVDVEVFKPERVEEVTAELAVEDGSLGEQAMPA
jgi:uncharacterized protein YqjF (DUF2071 family)